MLLLWGFAEMIIWTLKPLTGEVYSDVNHSNGLS